MLVSVRKQRSAIRLTLVMAGLLGGCDRQNEYVAPPPPAVTVSRPVEQPVTDYAEFTGTTEALESLDIRARVEGFLETVNFEAGAKVEEGSLLFVIDPKPFQAKLAQAEAELATRQAKLDLAEFDYNRVEHLLQQGAAPEFEFVQAKSAWKAAQAAVEAARAATDTARLSLDYTQIHAPINGRISRTFVDAGNLVGAGEYTLLATIVKDDPIYAYFSASERDLLTYLEKYPEKRTPTNPRERLPLYLGLSNEPDYPHTGYFDWADNRVDANTGTIQMRGVFPNSDHVLRPGLFVRIRAPIDTRANALLITDRALGADQGGRYLLVVNDQNVVEKRYIEIGALLDGMRVVEAGLKPADWIIVKGVQRAREGATVSPTRVEPPTSSAPATRPANNLQSRRGHACSVASSSIAPYSPLSSRS